jgi:hypothetical protein
MEKITPLEAKKEKAVLAEAEIRIYGYGER